MAKSANSTEPTKAQRKETLGKFEAVIQDTADAITQRGHVTDDIDNMSLQAELSVNESMSLFNDELVAEFGDEYHQVNLPSGKGNKDDHTKAHAIMNESESEILISRNNAMLICFLFIQFKHALIANGVAEESVREYVKRVKNFAPSRALAEREKADAKAEAKAQADARKKDDEKRGLTQVRKAEKAATTFVTAMSSDDENILKLMNEKSMKQCVAFLTQVFSIEV